MSGSCLLNDLEGLPLGVRAEFRIQLRRKGVLMAHKRTDGVQGNVFACQPRAERMPQRVKTTLYRLSVTPSLRPSADMALVKV